VTDQRLLLLLMMMMMVVTLLMVMCCSLFEEVQIDDGTRGLFRHAKKETQLFSKRLAGFVFHLSADPASPSCKESSSNAAKLNGANLMPAREREKRVRCRRGSRLLAAYLFR
jgi:hypothetical protein